MTSEAEFVGGPKHGTLMSFPGEEPPPLVILRGIDRGTAHTVTQFVYRREVSQLDKGPLWVFVPTSLGIKA